MYQGEVLKGTKIPHGRGIKILKYENLEVYYKGWLVGA
jgi:hypothetical protein